MPYEARKKGNKWEIVKKNTGKVVGVAKSRKDANASIRVRYTNEK